MVQNTCLILAFLRFFFGVPRPSQHLYTCIYQIFALHLQYYHPLTKCYLRSLQIAGKVEIGPSSSTKTIRIQNYNFNCFHHHHHHHHHHHDHLLFFFKTIRIPNYNFNIFQLFTHFPWSQDIAHRLQFGAKEGPVVAGIGLLHLDERLSAVFLEAWKTARSKV